MKYNPTKNIITYKNQFVTFSYSGVKVTQPPTNKATITSKAFFMSVFYLL